MDFKTMTVQTINRNYKTAVFRSLFVLGLMLSVLTACKKSDDFNAELKALPQIDYSGTYAYKSAYIVGDVMTITGRLQPNSNLQITIGGIAATIVKVDSVAGASINIGQQEVKTSEDQVTVSITAEMAGTAREVKITTGGYSVTGSPVDIYTPGGEGSFNSALKSVQVSADILSNAYNFLYAVTGKGDVYYYAPATKDLRHIQKDGSSSILYDLSALNISSFLAGGVDPQEQHLYFSVQLASGYALYQLNLQNNTLSQLNRSAGLNAPYEGPIGTAQMIVTGIYPDSKGNLYLGLGTGNNSAAPNFVPDAIARYNAATGSIRYTYKSLNAGRTYAGMPGVKISGGSAVRISPDENLLYTISNTLGGAGTLKGVQMYDLSVGTQLQDLEPVNANEGITPVTLYDVVAPFSALKINLFNTAERDFGYMPMPGKRLQVLLYQSPTQAGSVGFPRWIVFDFANQRTYAYDAGPFQPGQYTFRNTDQLLNYDETGNLYMTGNGQSYLLSTQPN